MRQTIASENLLTRRDFQLNMREIYLTALSFLFMTGDIRCNNSFITGIIRKIDKVGLDPCLKVSNVVYMEISYYNGL